MPASPRAFSRSGDEPRLSAGPPRSCDLQSHDDEAREAEAGEGGEAGTIVAHSPGQTTLTLTYQRQSSTGTYYDVTNGRRVVSVSIPIRVTP